MKSESESKPLAEDCKSKSCDLVITATQIGTLELSMQHVNSRKALACEMAVGPMFLCHGGSVACGTIEPRLAQADEDQQRHHHSFLFTLLHFSSLFTPFPLSFHQTPS
jgi:hypothetical protein